MSNNRGTIVEYKGDVIHEMSGDGTFRLLTKGKYTEDDIDITVNRDSVIEPKNISANGTYPAPTGVDGFSPVVVDVPNSYSASDEGKVVDGGELVAQTSLSIDENGTYDTTTNNEVVVDVAGGGGGESSTFNFPDYLAHSDQTKIAVSAKPDDFTSGSSSWDGMTVAGTPTKGDYYLNFGNSSYASFALSGANTDVTVYAIIRQYSVQSDGRVLFSIPYSGSSYNCPQYYSANGTLNSSVWGSDSAIGSATEWHVLSISIDGTNRKAYYYMDGVYLHEKSFSNSGGSVYLNSNTTSSIGKNSVAFFGIVEELESRATIIHNQDDLLTILKMTQFMNEYSDYLDTPVIAGASEPQSAIGANGDLFVEFEVESNVTNLKNTYNKVSGEWVKNSGGGGEPIDLSYLPNSDADNVLASKNFADGSNINLIGVGRYYVDLDGANTDVTCYCVSRATSNYEGIILCVPYSNSNGNSPSFYSPSSSYYVECTIYSGNTRVQDVYCDTVHVYALAIDATNKKVRYFIDGEYLMEKTFNNSGASVVVGAGDKNASSYYGAYPLTDYIGVVEEFESDATVIANMQKIMAEYGIGE